MSKKEQCELCRFYKRLSHQTSPDWTCSGVCRKFPPPYPSTDENRWCGEFKENKVKHMM